MMQGDSYKLPLEISTGTGPADDKSFLDVEVIIGDLRKSMVSGEITYDQEKKVFLFPLSQRETMALTPGRKPVQIRVKLTNGDVIGTQVSGIDVLDAISEVVL